MAPRRVIALAACLAAGVTFGLVPELSEVESSGAYRWLTSGLLAIGLYASTHGIALAEARRHWRLIVLAVTVGVLAKAALIGATLSWAFGDPRFWILGIAVAQIDPLSVAALMTDERVSPRAKTILSAWASFDDPMTVLLALYLPVLIVVPHAAGEAVGGGVVDYLAGFGVNMAFAALVGALWWMARRWLASRGVVIAGYLLVTASVFVATGWLFMIGLAVIGLFLRPRGLAHWLDLTVRLCLLAATALVGIQMAGGVDLLAGVTLGATAYAAQLVVGAVLTARLPRADRVFIALAQQNGITAIILSLLLEPAYPGTVAVVMPAVVTANVLHAAGRRFAARLAVAANPGASVT